MFRSKMSGLWRRAAIVSFFLCASIVGLIHFKQHAMIYHPRPYPADYMKAPPAGAVEIEYSTRAGRQVAFYIPARKGTRLPAGVWFAFCGNGSLALDWTTILAGYPNENDAFVLIDYPGYGKCAGYATIASTRASAEAALDALAQRLAISPDHLKLCTVGHSLGSAVALDFAARHPVQRVVAIAPFTTLREEAARLVSNPLSHLLIENYDDLASIEAIRKRNPDARIAIFHGTADSVIPVRMSRELARRFPFVEFFPIEGADHVNVLNVEPSHRPMDEPVLRVGRAVFRSWWPSMFVCRTLTK